MINRYRQTINKANTRIQWATEQLRAAGAALRDAQQGSSQLATCLEFVLCAVAAGVPVTFETARARGYLVHAPALTAVLRDAEENGYMRPSLGGRWELLDAGDLERLAYSLREHVKKSK